jgi:glycosyltransferase involved in cell wall biosynthesis
MAGAGPSRVRVTVDGKFFRAGERKFYVKGVGYGPFMPNAVGQSFASREQTDTDFGHIRKLGANLVRVYDVPGKWFLDLAAEHGLKVLVDIPWNKHLCFLDSPQLRADALNAVRRAVYSCARHPAVFAFSVANEIPADVVRWSGAHAVADFIDELVIEAKRIDSECLCTFTNYPPTEFLRPQNLDFVCFNVYLHNEQPFRNYLARLQMLAESKPLLLGEIGVDSLREGEARKCQMLRWQVEGAFRGGLAGAIVFNYTDDWWSGGRHVEDWAMGLTTRHRQPKESFFAVQRVFQQAPHFPLGRWPRISVVVASYNGDRTLKACLESLQRLNYPDYEVILVDDGSTDTTPQIAFLNHDVRFIRHEQNRGLSVARNTGIAAATGEIIAFTDSDCRADEDWLYYLASTFLESDFAGVGGPNLFPPEDSAVAAAVMASPGGPAHVMLTDRQAEHIPGCNMAFYKWALVEAGGFDPMFRRAGDDVDICWRVEQAGYKIGFSPAAFVWHYRRSAVHDYLKQQQGYGEAEAMLVRKHPEYFNTFGGSIWRGRIYTSAHFGVLIRPAIIYRGLFGSAGFQALYASQPAVSLMLLTTLEYHVLVTLPLWVLAISIRPLLPLAIAALLVSLGVCAAAGVQAQIPRGKARWWSRLLVATLFFLQPIVRGLARYRGRLTPQAAPLAPKENLDSIALLHSKRSLDEASYWAEQPVERVAVVAEILRRLEQQGWPVRSDIGWSEYDLEVYDTRWSKLQVTTVAEEHSRGRQCVRLRLRPRWSMRASLAFWTLCGLEAILLSWFATAHPWLWLMLLTLPLAYLFVRRENRKLQSVIRVFLDELAKDWNLAKADEPAQTPPPEEPRVPETANAADE